MKKLTLPIQIGKSYIRRDGTVITVRRPLKRFFRENTVLVASEHETYFGDISEFHHAFAETGLIHKNKQHKFDLVADTKYAAVKCPYATTLLAIASNEELQWLEDEDWNSVSHNFVLSKIADGTTTPKHFRTKPKTFEINGYSVPCAQEKDLEQGQVYYFPNLNTIEYFSTETWKNSDLDRLCRLRSIVHLTKEAAALHATALLSIK